MPIAVRSRHLAPHPIRVLALSLLLSGSMAWAQPAAPAAATPDEAAPQRSAMDAQLFYQVLMGEMQVRQGDPGAAYSILLDAARRTRDDQLFQRASDIALQARAGEQALAAALAWRAARPNTLTAHRYVVQLLVALNRLSEVPAALGRLIEATPARDKAAALASLPQFFARWPDKQAAVAMVQEVVRPYIDAPVMAVPARVAIGRVMLAAGDRNGALEAARQAHALDHAAREPALLASELVPFFPHEADAILRSFVAAQPDHVPVRMAYVRALVGAQRLDDARRDLVEITTQYPHLAEPWLLLGALQVEARQPRQALDSLQRYLTQAAQGASARVNPADDDEGSDTIEAGRVQAYLNLARASEQLGAFEDAERWLSRIEDAGSRLNVQLQRATILARQGEVERARALIRQVPEPTAQDARAKLIAEAQLLRTVSDWAGARAVLAQANERFADDVDLLYEQAMMSEKLDRLDEMETLLRRIIALDPDYHHAYNALGYTWAARNMRLQEARELIVKALSLAPGDPFITDSLGWVEYRLGNHEAALKALTQAYQARPDAEIGAHLGEVLWVTGQREEARRIWREVREREADNETLRETLQRLDVDL